MQAVINTREDLDAIAGTPEHVAFMALLAGTLWRLEKNDTAQAWVAIEVNSTIERFNFTRIDFPDAQPPILPAYVRPTLAEAITEKLAALSALRYTKETAGINVGGSKIKTDRESQAALTGAYTTLKNNLLQSIDWKADGGAWVSLALAQVEPMAQAVAAHVQACFTREKAHAQAIAGLTTVAQVDAYDISTGWPA